MAKKTAKPSGAPDEHVEAAEASAPVASEPAGGSFPAPTHSHEEDVAYAEKVVAKQAECKKSEAKKVVAALSEKDFARLVAAGRAGDIPTCHQILGLVDEEE